MTLRSVVGACAVSLCVLLSAAGAANLLTEGFDDITTLAGAGWVQTNNSSPPGETAWFQGTGIFVAQAGPDNSYIAANFNNAGFGGNVSNWLLTPTLALDPTVVMSFFTRTEEMPFPGDHLEIRLSTNGASSNVGGTDASVGDFTTLLLSINPTVNGNDYPPAWTQFSVSLNGVLAGPASGRFAFRYSVTDTSSSGDFIGIDTVQIASVPEPGSAMLLLAGSVGWVVAIARRRKLPQIESSMKPDNGARSKQRRS